MVLQIDALSSRELQAVLLAIKSLDKETQGQIRRGTKAIAAAEWTQALAEQANTRLEHRVLVDTGRVTPSNQNIKLSSATIGRSLSGGLNPSQSYAGVEFGANRNDQRTYTAHSSTGKSYSVTRRTKAQLRPRMRKGYVFYPAVARMVPRIAALWAQTVVRAVGEALEGKQGNGS